MAGGPGFLSMALTGLGSDNPLPGQYIEVRFAQGVSAGDLSPVRVLFIAPKTSAGAIVADTQVLGPFSDEADASAAGGAGSPAHRMIRRFLKICKTAEVYLVSPAAASGSAVVDKIPVTGPATANGAVQVTIAGETFDVGFAQGQSATDIAAAIAQAINDRTHLPVTASAASGTVTLTGKIAGVELNSIRFRVKSSGGGVGATPTADTALGTSAASGAALGVGTCSYTNVLATILSRNFDYIVPHAQIATPLGDLMVQVDLQAEPSTGYRQKVVTGVALDPASAQTLATGSSFNRTRARVIPAEESPEEHYLVAATVAAVFAKIEPGNPSENFDSYGLSDGQSLPLQPPYNDSARPTTTELKALLNNGCTPIAYTDGGQAYIVRSVTTRCKQGNNYDYRARDSVVVTVADAFAKDLGARIRSTPWKKITKDPVGSAEEPGKEFATPRRVKALIEILIEDYVNAGHLDPSRLQEMLDGLQVGIDPQVPSRMNSSIPLFSAVLLHQHALLVKESSAAT